MLTYLRAWQGGFVCDLLIGLTREVQAFDGAYGFSVDSIVSVDVFIRVNGGPPSG